MLGYQILREIENKPAHTQRSLAQHLGVSLGKAHYILTGLAEKGLIKVKRLKHNQGKIRWHYQLTSKGIEEKLILAKSYLHRRLEEFNELQKTCARIVVALHLTC